jgi:hypothetical protein
MAIFSRRRSTDELIIRKKDLIRGQYHEYGDV